MNYNYGFHIDSTPKTLCDNVIEYKNLINTKNPVIQLFRSEEHTSELQSH